MNLQRSLRRISSLKRFWKNVTISKGDNNNFRVFLDKRVLKTPQGQVIETPSELTALLVAAEWETQEKVLKPHSLPLTSVIVRSLAIQREEVESGLMRYLDTDSILYPQTEPPVIQTLQKKYWEPVYDLIEREFKIRPHTSAPDSFSKVNQPQDLITSFQREIKQLSTLELAVLERCVHSTKSFILGFCLLKRWISVEFAAKAARVELEAQIDRWGLVEDTHDIDFADIRRQLGAAVACLSH